MRKEPAFTGTAILALALGIGANTAIFSMVNGILLRPLSYERPEQLVLIREIVPMMGRLRGSWPANPRSVDVWRNENRSLSEVAAAEPIFVDYTSTGEPRQIDGVRASANIFDVLGVPPQLGRTFVPQEDQPGRDDVIIITDSFWRDEFHADRQVIGKKVILNGFPYHIVGVLPKRFAFPKREQLGQRMKFGSKLTFFKPLGMNLASFGPLGNFRFAVIARLKEGVTLNQALADIDVLQSKLSAEVGRKAGRRIELLAEVTPMEAEIVGPSRHGLLFLLGSVGAVLLIVCANLASLLLARVPRRVREAAIRASVGASSGRLMTQMIVEALPVGAFAGALGILFAYGAIHWLIRSAPVDLPRLDEVRIDTRVFGFALGLSIVTAVLFSLLPAFRVARSDQQSLLRSGATNISVDRSGIILRQLLIAGEMGLTALLLVLAASLTTSLVRVLNVDKGFNSARVLTVDVVVPSQKYVQPSDRFRFYENVRNAARSIPGVRSVAWISKLPLEGQAETLVVNVPGRVEESYENLMANYRYASPDYFQTAEIPLIRGRVFVESDRTKNVAVISENVARLVWPNEDPIGRQFHPGPNNAPLTEVIGVVKDVRTSGLDQPPVSIVYMPYWGSNAPKTASLVVRGASDQLASTVNSLRSLIGKVDRDVPILQVESMQQIVFDSIAGRRFQIVLAHSFAGFALFLTVLGIYSVVSYSIEQRRYEIGIRMVLGAAASDLQRLIVRQTMLPVLIGLSAGMVSAYFVGRIFAGLFFGTTGADPVATLASGLLMCIIAIIASCVPALRISNINPSIALRAQ